MSWLGTIKLYFTVNQNKSRDLQQLLKCFNGITTSVVEGGAGGLSFQPCIGHFSVFPVIFFLFLNDLPYEASSSISSISSP